MFAPLDVWFTALTQNFSSVSGKTDEIYWNQTDHMLRNAKLTSELTQCHFWFDKNENIALKVLTAVDWLSVKCIVFHDIAGDDITMDAAVHNTIQSSLFLVPRWEVCAAVFLKVFWFTQSVILSIHLHYQQVQQRLPEHTEITLILKRVWIQRNWWRLCALRCDTALNRECVLIGRNLNCLTACSQIIFQIPGCAAMAPCSTHLKISVILCCC